VPILATLVVFVLLYAGASLRYDNFFSYRVFEDLLKDNAVLGLAAIGMTFVILSGGIDLSVGAIVGLVSIGVARLIEMHGVSPAIALPLALAAGTLFGAGQGALIAFFALPPFLVTLAGLFLARGLAFLISPESIGIGHPFYDWVGDFSFDVFPLTATLFLAALAVALWVAHQTRFGRAVYAVGGNEASALLMGVPVRRTKILIYAASGLCAALAGITWSFYTNSGRAPAGELLELDAIAAVVIGGTLLTGGVGYIAGTLIGVLIFGIIQTSLTFEGTLTPYLMRIVIGGMLLGFILLQKLVQSRLGGRT
jgi:simple sugar transport system permease protein